MTNRLQKFAAELKRRKVFQVGSLYLVTAWGLSMGVAELFPTFGAPDWAAQYVITRSQLFQDFARLPASRLVEP